MNSRSFRLHACSPVRFGLLAVIIAMDAAPSPSCCDDDPASALGDIICAAERPARIAAIDELRERVTHGSGNEDLLQLAEVLNSEEQDRYRQQWAAFAIRVSGGKSKVCVAALVKGLESPDIGVRVHSVLALAGIAPDQVEVGIDVLCEALWTEIPEIQVDAAKALGALGPRAKEAVPYLAAVIAFNNRECITTWRREVVYPIPPMSQEDGKRPVWYTIPDDVSAPVGDNRRRWDNLGAASILDAPRKACADALGKIGGEARGAIPFLLAASTDPEPVVAEAARAAVADIQKEYK